MISSQTGTGSRSLQAAGSRRSSRPQLLFGSLAALLWTSTALAQTLPTGGSVVSGNVTLASPGAGQMTINQSSDKAIVNWNSFSVGSGAQLDFNQPSAQSAILNRVTGSTTSEIHGRLTANGQVHLVNPNGIYIGPGGKVSAAGFVASTLNITDEDFLSGALRYSGSGSSRSVENAGEISILPGGYAALIGGRVDNSGVIAVPLGKVGLGAGESVTLDISGDGFLQVAVPSDGEDTAIESLVSNSGRIVADGGVVQLKAASARDAARRVVNMSGIIEARSVGGVSGAVVLGGSGGGVRVSGRIDASARATLVDRSPRPAERPDTGGSITITGAAIELVGAVLDTSGAKAGDGGSIRIGGDYQGGGDLQRAETTLVDADTQLISDGGETGNGGTIIVWADGFTSFAGAISARGGTIGGDGGFAEVSGKEQLAFGGWVDTSAPLGETGTLLLDPYNVTIVDGPGNDLWSEDLGFFLPTDNDSEIPADVILRILLASNVLITTDNDGQGNQDGNITVDADLSWATTTTLALEADNAITLNGAINAPSGGLDLTAQGAVDGIGLITANEAVNVAEFTLSQGFWQQVAPTLPDFVAADFELVDGTNFLRALGGEGSLSDPLQLTDIYGLQGIGGGALEALNFEVVNDIDASVTSGWTSGFSDSGFVAMDFSGTLDGNRHNVTGLFIDTFSGGSVFDTLSGTVRDLRFLNADVTSDFGGILAGTNFGTVSGVMVSGTYSARDAFGGGLVGFNGGTISDSFSTADVFVETVEGGIAIAGGLAAVNTGTIERSNSSGLVEAETFGTIIAGGLVGNNFGQIDDSYSTSDVEVFNFGDTQPTTLGGLVGINENDDDGGIGSVARSFSTGTLTAVGGDQTFGGLVGENLGNVANSFWDSQNSGQATSAGGTPLTTAEFQDTQGFYDLASAVGWDFETVWAPGSSGFYPANYTTTPVIFAIPNDIVVAQGDVPTATTTGSVFGGPSLYRFGPSPDSLATSPVFSNLSFASDAVGTTTFTLDTSNRVSENGQVYRAVALTGSATITEDPVDPPDDPPIAPPADPDDPVTIDDPIDPVPLPVIEITPTIDTSINDGGTVVTPVAKARLALQTIEGISSEYEDRISECASQGEDVSQYLSCLADATEDYADELESIVEGLPPGLDNIADIIRGAGAGIRDVGRDAGQRLALAQTVQERQAIRREAGERARTILRQAQQEIRKEISLIRAEDPELASLHRQQVETIAASVGKAEIALSRAIGL